MHTAKRISRNLELAGSPLAVRSLYTPREDGMLDSMDLIAERLSDGAYASVTGFGKNKGLAWIDAAERMSRVLVPNSVTPGWDWEYRAGRFNDEAWVQS